MILATRIYSTHCSKRRDAGNLVLEARDRRHVDDSPPTCVRGMEQPVLPHIEHILHGIHTAWSTSRRTLLFLFPLRSNRVQLLDVHFRSPYHPLIVSQSTSSTPASPLARLISSIIPSEPSICGSASRRLTGFSVLDCHPLYHETQATHWKHSAATATIASSTNSVTLVQVIWLKGANGSVVTSHTVLHVESNKSAERIAIVFLSLYGSALWNFCRNWWVRKAWIRTCALMRRVVVI
jgi:hypothetical protein